MYDNTKKTICSQVVIVSVLLSLSCASQIEAASPKRAIKEGNLLYEQGDYIASEKKYKEALEKDSESDIINFNVGAVLYKKEEYGEAMDHFQKVYLSEDDQLKQKAYYNSGNALYKIGISEERRGSATAAIPHVEQSLKQYDRALGIDEHDEDTKHNYAFVQKELKRLKEIQKQEQQEDDQEEDSEQSEDQEQQQGEQSQNSQEQKGQKGQEQQQGQQSQNSQEQQGQEGQEQQQQQGQQQEQGNEQEGQQQGQQAEQQDLDQGQGQKDREEGNNQQNTGTQSQSASELTPQEALMLLERYQQSEEPKQPLTMQPKVNNSSPVLNDW